ncbi:hypothetical protein FB45DRAFT_930155 [Roridomyces roridus]|uniref:Secreted protein n=1 Tax=Roridomyces roridus TaxID=1738132 RepID=A0AAD7BHA6_9AGAR|nr:hypothetical protein FB45DRAFT_930155 [Roridomyces roridus]
MVHRMLLVWLQACCSLSRGGSPSLYQHPMKNHCDSSQDGRNPLADAPMVQRVRSVSEFDQKKKRGTSTKELVWDGTKSKCESTRARA